jgi:hypothetical protein
MPLIPLGLPAHTTHRWASYTQLGLCLRSRLSRLSKGVYVVILRTCAENGRMPYCGVERYGWRVCLGFETT